MAPNDPTAIGESQPGPSDDEQRSALPVLFRSYKRAASRLRDVFDAPEGELATSFGLSFEGDVLTTSFSAGARIHRHAALAEECSMWAKQSAAAEICGILYGIGLDPVGRLA